MILTVVQGKRPTGDLIYVGVGAAALCGAGIGQPFSNGGQGQIIVARGALGPQGVTVQCVQAKAYFAKLAYEGLGFQIIEAVSPVTPPPRNYSVTLTVTPALADKDYPFGLGAEGWGETATNTLNGAGLLKDPYSGGATTSFQVACDKNDLASVIGGFAFALFKATPT